MIDQWWSWVVTFVGVTCFFLAGSKIWWAWYVGLAGQFLWFAYAFTTEQWGFLVGAFLYTFVYTRNAIRWTREHPREPKPMVYPKPAIPRVDELKLNDLIWIEGDLFRMTYYRHGRPGELVPKMSLTMVSPEEAEKVKEG